MADVIFGMFIPQGWKMEYAGFGTASEQWRRSVEIAQLAERSGLDSVWVYDHFHNVPKPAHEAVFECWTTIAAISQRTSRIRLGQMVGCNLYREPSLLAKITSTIDVISGGRLDWGIGAGWYENECLGYGYDFPSPKERIAMLRECVEIVKMMWSEPETNYDGTYYTLVRGNCDPKPVQKPRPPIWIGGGGEQLTLRVVARHADYANFGGTEEDFLRKKNILAEHCKAVGRDMDEIGLTWSPEVFMRESEREVEQAGSRSLWGHPLEQWRATSLVGTPEQVSEKVARYVNMGCVGFVPWCADYPDTTTLDLFAGVAKQFR